MNTQICVRISEEMKQKLEEVAKADRRSVSFVVKEAIQKYLDSLEK